MAFIEQVNSKANVKQFTTNDLPSSPSQPVINSYYATSTAGQTSIVNLGFTVNTLSTGFTDSFWLFVDGKKLDLGSSNDYVFSAIAADGSSSSIAFNQSLAAGLNIQAFKLGLKPEIQFGMDNRFTQLYANQAAGFQGFVSQTDFLITSTSSAGTPPAGQFYSSIVGRASMPDLSQDLKVRMGDERIATQQIYQVQNEFGPNGEQVWATPNDLFGQIRFVGSWNDTVDSTGVYSSTSTSGDYVETTFYGTGLNVLVRLTTSARDWRVSVDGGSEGSNIYPSSASGVLDTRNYTQNIIIPAVSGLSLGIHTVKIRKNESVAAFNVAGFEILNESSSINVNPGIGYIQGQKVQLAAQSSFSYSAPVTGTRGGRVLVYQKADGSIGSSFQATNTSAAYASSADHTNEEPARTSHWREYGAGRSDDFSSLVAAGSTRAFTLEDNTSTLFGQNVSTLSSNAIGDVFGPSATNDFIVVTFIGTGLDIVHSKTVASTGNYTVYIDGTSVATNFNPAANSTAKVVSGLPYGAHTAKFLNTNGAGNAIGFSKFIAYQPKKPALPAGAIELADYNVLANYDGTTITGTTANLLDVIQMPVGTIMKSPAREFAYSGANWTINGVDSLNVLTGWETGTTTNNNQPASYTFFGTGAVIQLHTSGGATVDFSVSIDGSLNASGVARSNISNLGGGSYRNTSTTSGAPARVEFTGLTLGKHTISLQRTAGAGNFYIAALHVITPIHSYKSNIYSDLQNALPVGSNSISDNRKITPIKEALPSQKAWAQAIGITSGPTTTSTSNIPVPDMSVTIKTSGGALDIFFSIDCSNNTANAFVGFYIYVDGILMNNSSGNGRGVNVAAANDRECVSDSVIVPVSAGPHKVDLYWATGVGTATASTTERILKVREI